MEIVELNFYISKNTIGGEVSDGEFSFGLYDSDNNMIKEATNDANGLVVFENICFPSIGEYNYTIKEIGGPDCWINDDMVYPVQINILENEVIVKYPKGTPHFKNIYQSNSCGLIEFGELSFTSPGVYEYFIKEISTSGGGWIIDPKEYLVIINVTDDGYGNLVATASYPDGFPVFINTFKRQTAKYVISAIKKAEGAPLPKGKFIFGLFDEDGSLISTATNN